MASTMRLLVLSPTIPYPPTDGGRIRVWNLLRHAAREFSITLCALETVSTDRQALETLRECGIEPVLVSQRQPKTPPLNAPAFLRALVRRWPLTVAKYAPPGVSRCGLSTARDATV
ncbi:MAG: hypothetical protein KatS3mg115_2628 [Candidatus Poribacteria bacterium]|nr:MAG: hypothetical protein KatS3mg115_2628 [Candidatus Poribacteria bacterium]